MNEKLIGKAASFPYMIWDMDGTILDSMRYWLSLGADYLRLRGITPPEDLRETIDSMTLEESAAYFQKEFGIDYPGVYELLDRVPAADLDCGTLCGAACCRQDPECIRDRQG